MAAGVNVGGRGNEVPAPPLRMLARRNDSLPTNTSNRTGRTRRRKILVLFQSPADRFSSRRLRWIGLKQALDQARGNADHTPPAGLWA